MIRLLRRHRAMSGLVFGLLGGACGWTVAEPARFFALEAADRFAITAAWAVTLSDIAFAGVFAAYLGMVLGAIDGLLSGNLRLVARGGWIGGFAGLVAGAAGTTLGLAAFLLLKDVSASGHVGRWIGWALVGSALGLGPGIALSAQDRLKRGALGGLAGGLAGGMLFSATATTLTQDVFGRMAGVPLLGASLGLSYALAEELLRRSWLTILSGKSEGLEYVLPPRSVTIGGGERADVLLRADPPLPGLALALTPLGQSWSVRRLDIDDVLHNKQPLVNGTRLADGDILKVRSVRVLFSSKVAGAALSRERQTGGGLERTEILEPGTAPPDQAVSAGADAAAGARRARADHLPSFLEWMEGPRAGQRVALDKDRILIGRDDACDIVIDDLSVSLRHAEIVRRGKFQVVFDLGSTNGTFVQGRRVAENALRPGFTVTFGTSSFKYVEE